MIKRAIGLAVLVFMLTVVTVLGQENNYGFSVQTLGGYTTPGVVPFWLRANQFGSIPLDGASLSFIGAARKDYDMSIDRLFDWGASFEGRANIGQGSNLTLVEGYGKVRLGVFELRAGRSKKITGLCDTTLTSGSWAISGTNLGIPEVELSVRDFWTLPILGELFAFKGNYSHGWMGNEPKDRPEEVILFNQITYLHQKSFYGRFGKPVWRFKLYGGFNHQVLWGSEMDYYTGSYYGDDYNLSGFETYLHIISGRRVNNGSISQLRLGNHLGSIDLGFEYNFEKVKLMIYRQHLYDAGALYYLANIQDGLNGIKLEKIRLPDSWFKWSKILLEVLYTKNQAGAPNSPETPSSYENYYNHGQYAQGWSYNGIGQGTPFVSTREDLRSGVPDYRLEYFVNNRVFAFHYGCEGYLGKVSFKVLASWSANYGTYMTTDEEQSTGIANPGMFGLFGVKEQFSTLFQLEREFETGLSIATIGAFDVGELYYDSFGVFLRISYSFIM